MSKKADQKYKGNGNHEWEFAALNTYRLRVPGGWLYRYEIPGESYYVPPPAGAALVYGASRKEAPVVSTQFVPMPEVVKHKV
jgi:hypothetical protein